MGNPRTQLPHTRLCRHRRSRRRASTSAFITLASVGLKRSTFCVHVASQPHDNACIASLHTTPCLNSASTHNAHLAFASGLATWHIATREQRCCRECSRRAVDTSTCAGPYLQLVLNAAAQALPHFLRRLVALAPAPAPLPAPVVGVDASPAGADSLVVPHRRSPTSPRPGMM